MRIGSIRTRLLSVLIGLAVAGPVARGAEASTEVVDWERVGALMDTDRFWVLVEEARTAGRSSCAAAAHLPRILMRLSPDEILAFELQLRARFDESYRWDLWAVAYIVNGGASDDGFEYFRGWLIAQGRAYFEAALRDPERAADRASQEASQNECEGMLSPGFYAYHSKTGREPPSPPFRGRREPAGQRWDEQDVGKLYPKLAERFR
jgi:hypothetical protein